MNTFKRKALMSAVLAGLGVAGTAEAVYQNPNGLGQVLIYPYYTVNSASGNVFNTYISVVNTTNRAKVVKVRFREGKNSREVLDFNLYLSPNDVFTGAVIPASADATAPGRFLTTDRSCTNPAIPAAGVDFRNFEYTGTAADGGPTGLDRTREGYVEMIELALLNAPDSTRATHVAGVPANCAALQGNPVTFATAFSSPTGGLTGTGTLINVNSGLDMTYNAVALADFSANFFAAATIGTDVPNLGDADNVSLVVSRNVTDSHTNAYVSAFADILTTGPFTVTDGAQAVSATMMHNNVINEFVLDSGTRSNTDWVLTFPTKRYFVTTLTAIAPFTRPFTANGACEVIGFTFLDREEGSVAAAGADFSPLPPGAAPNSICWESTVLSLRNGATHMPTSNTVTGVLGSSNNTNITVTNTFQNGWGRLLFNDTNSFTNGMVSAASQVAQVFPVPAAFAASAVTYRGLPVVGFMVRTFINNTVTCGTATCQANYGGLFPHNYTQSITP